MEQTDERLLHLVSIALAGFYGLMKQPQISRDALLAAFDIYLDEQSEAIMWRVYRDTFRANPEYFQTFAQKYVLKEL